MSSQIQLKQNERFVNELLYKEEVYSIIGAAIEVHKNLGSGFLEPVYQEAFEIELKSREIFFQSQCEIAIHYKDFILQKNYRADLVAFEKIIVELKATDHITPVDESQIINYLKATKFRLGLLINFGSVKMEWKRLVL